MVLGFSIIGINIFYVIYTSYIYVCTCNVTSISMDKVYVCLKSTDFNIQKFRHFHLVYK